MYFKIVATKEKASNILHFSRNEKLYDFACDINVATRTQHPFGYVTSNEVGDFNGLQNLFASVPRGEYLFVGATQGFNGVAFSLGGATGLTMIDSDPFVTRSSIIYKNFLKLRLEDNDSNLTSKANYCIYPNSDPREVSQFLWDTFTEGERDYFYNMTVNHPTRSKDATNIHDVEIKILKHNYQQESLALRSCFANSEAVSSLADIVLGDKIRFINGSITHQESADVLQDNPFSLIYISNLLEWTKTNPLNNLRSFVDRIPLTEDALIIESVGKGLRNSRPVYLEGENWDYSVYGVNDL